MKKVCTLAFIHENNRILLAMKKRGWGSDMWNGYGGKVEEGESIESAVVRETAEEIGIKINNAVEVGVLRFMYADDLEIEAHVFRIIDFEGLPHETEEMKPQWFKINDIPYNQMWPDDKYWLPLFLANKKFTGQFWFGKDKEIVTYDLKEA